MISKWTGGDGGGGGGDGGGGGGGGGVGGVAVLALHPLVQLHAVGQIWLHVSRELQHFS